MEWTVPFNTRLLGEALLSFAPDVFGIFATIERGAQVVHGCQGEWSLPEGPKSGEEWVFVCKDVAKRAARHDSRNRDNLRKDVSATLTLSFMLKSSVTEVKGDESKGEGFDPVTFGLIAVGPNGERATYLPGVFPSTSPWSYVRDSLVREKLGYTGDIDTVRFMQYRTVTMGYRLVALLGHEDAAVPRMLACQSLRMFASPAALQVFEFDPQDYVRHAGTLYFLANLLQCCGATVDADVRLRAQAWLEAWAQRFHRRDVESVQRDGFLLRASVKSPLLFTTEAPFRVTLEAALENPKLDPMFVRPQAVLALADASVVQVRFIESIAKRYRKASVPASLPVDEIFRLNWDIQALRVCLWKDDLKIVARWLLSWANEHVLSFDSLETNVLACAFEAVRNLNMGESDASLLLSEWLLADVLQRSRCSIEGEALVYRLLSGSTRLDMTAHVVNGWLS